MRCGGVWNAGASIKATDKLKIDFTYRYITGSEHTWQTLGSGTLQPGAPELRADARFNRDAVAISSSYDIGLDWLTVELEHSHLTIEHAGSIPVELRPAIGNRVYGCDDCQDACPWNAKFARDVALPAMAPHRTEAWPEPRDWLALDDDAYRARFRGTAMTRPKRAGLVRNAAVAIGNRADPADAPALRAALETETDAMARAHLTWALARCTA